METFSGCIYLGKVLRFRYLEDNASPRDTLVETLSLHKLAQGELRSPHERAKDGSTHQHVDMQLIDKVAVAGHGSMASLHHHRPGVSENPAPCPSLDAVSGLLSTKLPRIIIV